MVLQPVWESTRSYFKSLLRSSLKILKTVQPVLPYSGGLNFFIADRHVECSETSPDGTYKQGTSQSCLPRSDVIFFQGPQ